MITPIFKAGCHLDCNNYRGISINSCLGKLFTSVLQSRLLSFLEDNNKLSDKQAAFRPGFSTTDHLFTLRSIINRYINVRKEKLFVCFVDFRKAFDKVWRNGLFVKLLRMGITGKFYNILKIMYQSTKSKVKLPKGLSPSFDSNTGIKQGDGLSPLLFNIFIDDINTIFDTSCDPVELGQVKIHNLLYADDLVIISISQNGLQNSLNKLKTYCNKWHLDINVEKTKTMVFSKSGKVPKTFQVTLNDKVIETTKTYKYLGLLIHNNGNFMKGTSELKTKARKAWFKCKNILYSNKVNNVQLLLELFDKLVKPILLYGVEVWGPDYLKQLILKDDYKTIDKCFCEMIHNMACKSILGVSKYSSNIAARAELGRTPLYPYITGSVFRFWYKLISQSKSTILKESYFSELELNNTGKPSWLTAISHIHDISSWKTWKTQTYSLIKFIVADVQQQYKENIGNYLTNLKSDGIGHKLRTYCHIKCDHEIESYLLQNLPRTYRSRITSLRIGSHNLEIEQGRYQNPPIAPENRFCKAFLPENSCVGDELHFLITCPMFAVKRSILINKLSLEYSFKNKDDIY